MNEVYIVRAGLPAALVRKLKAPDFNPDQLTEAESRLLVRRIGEDWEMLLFGPDPPWT